jgi:hypothetical protein
VGQGDGAVEPSAEASLVVRRRAVYAVSVEAGEKSPDSVDFIEITPAE